MINSTKPISMAESKKYLEKDSETLKFIKNFSSLDSKKASELREKLEGLDLLKLDEKHISKVIDLMPETNEEINKIFVDVGLNEDETQKILNTIKEFK